MTELKPCPFCGGKAALVGSFNSYAVRCTKCGAETREVEMNWGIFTPYYAIINEAAELWNKRVGESK